MAQRGQEEDGASPTAHGRVRKQILGPEDGLEGDKSGLSRLWGHADPF